MARSLKLTKFSAENALAKAGSVTDAALYAGVNRRTLQRAMKRFGIRFVAVSEHSAASIQSPPTDVAKPQQVSASVEPKPRNDAAPNRARLDPAAWGLAPRTKPNVYASYNARKQRWEG